MSRPGEGGRIACLQSGALDVHQPRQVRHGAYQHQMRDTAGMASCIFEGENRAKGVTDQIIRDTPRWRRNASMSSTIWGIE